jgi:hypothetical protein
MSKARDIANIMLKMEGSMDIKTSRFNVYRAIL